MLADDSLIGASQLTDGKSDNFFYVDIPHLYTRIPLDLIITIVMARLAGQCKHSGWLLSVAR